MGRVLNIANQVSDPVNAVPVTEIPATDYEDRKQKVIASQAYQRQDVQPGTVLVDATLWTDNLGPCHAVCMYGDFRGKHIGMLLGHFSHKGWTGLKVPVDGMLAKMKEMCTLTGIYIIGGRPMNPLLFGMLGEELDKSLVKCVLSPLTTDAGGRAAVFMYKNSIEWCIYREEG
jgi:hypothetical protein